MKKPTMKLFKLLPVISILLAININTSFAANTRITAINDSPNRAIVTIGRNAPVTLAPSEIKYLSADFKYSDPLVFQSVGLGQSSTNCQFPVLTGNQHIQMTGITISITQDPQSRKVNCLVGWE